MIMTDAGAQNLHPNSHSSSSNIDITYKALNDLCEDNAGYFASDTTENGQRMNLAFLSIRDNVNESCSIVGELRDIAGFYDYDESTPGNGYRTFIFIYNLAVKHAIQINKKVLLKRDSVLFRKAYYTKEVEVCAQLIASLGVCIKHVKTIKSWCKNGDLFPQENVSPDDIWTRTQDINQYCFYGRNLGFQFCDSMKYVLRFVGLSMVIYSEAYYHEGNMVSRATNSVMTTTKFLADPEERAKRIVNISKNASIEFLKSFWFLSESELMGQLPSVVAENVEVCKVIQLPPEPLTLNYNGKTIDIPIPSSHIGKRPIQVRLISHLVRDGMIGEAKRKGQIHPPSRGLIVHCHGGGFVAQSSKSHECYLRQWAKELAVPILSIDYSLAPEAPYPRAHEEVTYVYCWILQNYGLLGTTGERIVGAGDSAGANLILGTSLKCIELGIPPPAGLFIAYAPLYLCLTISPSRLLAMMDPLLPYGFMIRLLKAYICPDPHRIKKAAMSKSSSQNSESFEEISESDLVELQAHKSPTSDTDTLTYGSLSSQPDTSITEDMQDKALKVRDATALENLHPTTSQQQVSDFLEKYVLDSDTDTDGSKLKIVTDDDVAQRTRFHMTLQEKVSTFVTNIKGRIGSMVSIRSTSGAALLLDVDKDADLQEHLKIPIPNVMYLSPLCATDEVLKKLPPIRLMTTHLDPFLDDCIMFAKRLKSVDHNVSLDLLEGLPHGFLSLSMVSNEANEGSNLSMKRLKELLDLENLPKVQT